MNEQEIELSPTHRLTLLLLVLRGGRASQKQIIADGIAWGRMYGKPTDESVRAWQEENKMELDIGLAASKSVAEKHP